MAPPSLEMIQQTIKSLLASGVVYRMGDHLFVLVPTTSPPKVKVGKKEELKTGNKSIDKKKIVSGYGRMPNGNIDDGKR